MNNVIKVLAVAGHLWLSDFVKKGYLYEIDNHDNDILPIIANEMQ